MSKTPTDQRSHLIGVLYGTELFGRERENIECYKTIQSIGWDVQVFGSYREEEGGAVGRQLKAHDLLQGVLPFGSHFALSYFRKIKGYPKKQYQRIRDCSKIVLKHIRHRDPNALFMGSHTEFLYIWPALLLSRVPVIYRVGDGPIWDSTFHRFAMKCLLRRATIVVPVSHFIAKECSLLLPAASHKTSVIWNIPPSFGGVTHTQDNVHYQKELRLVYVGQMTEKKGVKVLIKALAEIKDVLPIKCRIVGGSQYSSSFEKEMHQLVNGSGLTEYVHFTGRVEDPTPHYSWAHLHIAPSLYEEPFGLVIVEAKRSGIPSIVFPKGGMPELIEHEKNGWVCDDASQESLVSAILACSKKPLNQWGKEALQSQVDVFSGSRFQDEWRTLLSPLTV
ncbi:glycosyltransferase family 4 protein [Flavobacteriales bacterium]|nr:glycosyltransferase family 4 protein [Flavobacteriales bacterium]